ncbi:MAG: hypothetical protein F4207_11625 [Gemmatimonadetes bacterium]|nr:hypothetical protein [Gemmatimonadota bacterium]MYG17054.1 hypothetical protein [Gemmatimonadota bacterium]
MPVDIQTDSLIWILIAFILVGILIYGLSRRLFSQLSPAAAWGLIGLRIAAAAVALAVLSDPVSRMVLERTESPRLAVLVDTSASMGLTDRLGRRNEVLASVLSGDALHALESRHRVHRYRFAENLSPLPEDVIDSLSTEGTGTDIGGAMSFLEGGSGAGRFGAAVLVTDGNFTAGRDPLRVAEDLDMPVYTVGIGDTLGVRDIGVSHLAVNEVVYTGSNVPIEVGVRGRGFGSVRVPVILRDEGRILQSEEVTLDDTDEERTVVFHVVPETEGIHRYQVEVPELDGEITAGNNRREFAISVLKSGLRVLYIEGAPRADMGFLKRSMEKDANLEVTSILFRPDDRTFPEPMPASRTDWFSYDLVILGSVDYERIRPWAPLLVAFVEERGGGLIAFGGPHSFEMGGYAGTPVGDLMPFAIAASARGLSEEAFVPDLTSDGRTHPITRLDDDPAESERRWLELPPLPGMNQVGRAKPGATVLARHPTWRTEDERTPVIAEHRYGQGRVLAIAAQGLWRWDLMMWGSGGTNAAYERFWNNAVRWITVREGSRRIRVVSDKLQYHGGETIRFDGQVYDENYRPVEGAELTVTVRPAQDEADALQINLTSTGQGFGRYAGRLQFLPAGAYSFEASAVLSGVPIGTDRGGFVVGEAGAEFERTRMNRELLVQLADMTGGGFYLPSDIDRMADDIELDEITVQESRTVSLWNHPGVLALLVCLLAAEWFYRRYLGMV